MKINVDEIMKMTLNELTLEQFVFVALILLVCTALAVIIFIMILQIIGMLIDLVFYLVCKNKRHGGWWFKRDLCRYIGRLKHQTIKAPTEKAYYLYYNRLIGAVEALFYARLIDNDLYLKLAAKGIPSYYDLKKECKADENKPTEKRSEVDTDK